MKARIQIRDIPHGTPSNWLEDTGLYLDLGDSFTFNLSKAANESNGVNEIKREGTSSFAIPMTGKNKWILNKWLFPNNHNRDYSPLRVYAYDGSHLLTEDRLEVLESDRSAGLVEIGLFESTENGWIEAARNTFVKDLDFGTFELLTANLQANWAIPQWEPGQDYFYWPLIHYGNFIVDISEVSPEDFRPLLSVAGTLELGFCAIGWTFASPLLGSDWFKRLWWYGLGKEYYNHSDLGRLYRIDVENSGMIIVNTPGIITLDVENYDLGGNYDNGTGAYTNAQPFTILQEWCLEGQIENQSAISVNNLTIEIVYDGTATVFKSFDLTLQPSEVYDFSECFTEQVPSGDAFQIFVNGFAVNVLAGFKWTINPAGKHYCRGDIIDIRESVDPNYSFLQFLEGFAHKGFKFDVDYGRRVVSMFPPEGVDVFGTTLDGYYVHPSMAVDYTSKAVKNSDRMTFPREDIPEKLIIGYKESTDKYIETLEVPEDAPLYAKIVTFADGIRDSIETSENPFFEPTANYQWFGQADPQVNTPAMWDNSAGERSFEIAPRLLYAEGLIEQTAIIGGNLVTREWSFDGGTETELPYAFQVPGSEIGDPPAYPSGYVVYDDPDFNEYTAWKMFLKFDNRFSKDLPELSLLIQLNSNEYHSFSFRYRIMVEIAGRLSVFRVAAINDFQTEENIPTPFTLIFEPDADC